MDIQINDNKGERLEVQGFCEQVYQKYEILHELGEAYMGLEQYEQAVECFQEAIRHEPRLAEAHTSLGMAAIRLNQPDVALTSLQKAVQVNPRYAKAYAGLAVVHQRARQFPRAFEMYLKSLELDGDNLLALLGLFQTSCRMGTFSKITFYLESYLERHPDDASVMFCLATLYAKDGMLEDARDVLMRLLAAEPDKQEAVDLLEKVQNHIRQRRASTVEEGVA
ncbi:MAG: tetratricopeptide repeat protein [Phycisphaerae bacterium]